LGLTINFPDDMPDNNSIQFAQIKDESILYRNGKYLFQLVDEGAIVINTATQEVHEVVRFLADWLIEQELGDYFMPTSLRLEINIKSL